MRNAFPARGLDTWSSHLLPSEIGDRGGLSVPLARTGRMWDTPSRPRTGKHPTENKHADGWGDWPVTKARRMIIDTLYPNLRSARA